MESQTLLKLPIPGSGCGDTRFFTDNLDLLAEFEYRRDGVDWVGCIRFVTCVAFRFRDEYRSSGFCLDSYDAVVKIDDSIWISELKQGEPKNKMGLNNAIHFAVFFSSNGYLEVIAHKFEMKDPRKGFLDNK